MKYLKRLLLLGLMLALIGGAVGYYMWNKPHQNVVDATPDKILTADELYGLVKGKDSLAVVSLNKKIYQASGVISSINAPNDSSINILLSISSNPTDNINCAMDPKFNTRLHDLKAGDKITLKGIFSGVNRFEDKDLGISTLDIILTRGVAIRE